MPCLDLPSQEMANRREDYFGGSKYRRRASHSSSLMPTRSDKLSTRKSRPVLPTLKLGTYDGSSCLKTFLSKYENCSDYYEWTDRERLCQSLEGPAGQLLWVVHLG